MTETIRDCRYPWTWMVVGSDGRVLPCCFAQQELGNLNQADVHAIWNGAVAQALRRCIKRGEIHPICQGAICKYVENTCRNGHGEE